MDASITNSPKSSPRVYTGTDNFYNLLIEGDVFVDKSLFIKEFLQDSSGEVVLITRPRRWGKSMNMDMLNRFLAIEIDEQGNPLPQEQCRNHKLFTGGEVVVGPTTGKMKRLSPLKIAQQYPDLVSDYQGKYPVISLGFKDVTGDSYQEIEEAVRLQITDLYRGHSYLEQHIHTLSSSVKQSQQEKLQQYFTGKFGGKDTKNSLRFLGELLSKHFGQNVYVLIDEYDTPINNAFIELKEKPKEFNEVLKLFRELFGNTFKGNPYLKRGLITGILRVAKANLFSSINNVQEYT
ncbi:MAG: AAA family ATPase, partial [Bacteroidota bacterium]